MSVQTLIIYVVKTLKECRYKVGSVVLREMEIFSVLNNCETPAVFTHSETI